MKSTEYSDKVLDHFKHPRNVGSLEGPNVAVGRVGNPVCGDLMEISIKVESNVIEDIKFKTFGCGSAVATSSMITEMVKGKSLDDALKVSRKDVANELDGLPPVKMHCSNLAADALHEAIKNWNAAHGIETKHAPQPTSVLVDEVKECVGEKEYLGKGVYHALNNFEVLKDKRVLIVYKNNKTVEDAIALTKYTGRVVLISKYKEIGGPEDLMKILARSDVKVLLQSALLEIHGENDVERVKILNLDENEEYELFVDAVVIPE